MLTEPASRRTPVRVVHLITELDVGGAETMLSRLVAALDRSRVESTVVSLAAGGLIAARIAKTGVRVVELGMRPARPNVVPVIRLVRLLRSIKPHVLQTWLYHADLVGLIAGSMAHVPAVAWNIRCSRLEYADYSRLLPLVVRVLAAASRWPDVVICNSAAGRVVHEGLGYSPRRWAFIPNGVDTDVFRPCGRARAGRAAELGVEPGTPIVGLVARFHPMKDHVTFLRAAALIARDRPDVHFVIVGRGVTGSKMLKALVIDLELERRVHLEDERHDMPRVLAGLDVAVSSSNSGEGFPNVVIEAMACGVPCVVTDVGDAAAVVGDTGITVSPRDPASLAAAVLRLLVMTSAEHAVAGSAARERVVREFSLRHVTACYQHLYEQLASLDRKPARLDAAG